jgi:hypothetical protein
MTMAFYFSARRPAPLSSEEQQAVQKIIDKYSVDERIRRRAQTGEGLNWHHFHLAGPDNRSTADTILEGHTRLPDDSEEAAATGLVHWCNVVSAFRRAVHKALWSVQVEDIEIGWDYVKEAYDPAKE